MLQQRTIDNDPAFESLLRKIRRERGLDCNQYKSAFLQRRLAVRLRARGVKSYRAYTRLLDDEEYDQLFDALTINLTHFFRDATTFVALRDRVLRPMLGLKAQQGRRQFRAWSAGCASGEEPYSLAILLHQMLGAQIEEWQIRILATDLDQRRLEQAQAGVYSPFSFRGTQWPDMDRFFVTTRHGHTIVPQVKRLVRFRRHDLIGEEPPGRFDLILCRNVLIYFTRLQQVRLCRAFHSALMPDGVLVLGKTEILPGEVAGLFEPVDLREHIYRSQ
ncbi:MAG: protein-glutamate O-methyltransferase CheR [Chloroflexi bacterium]|nr:MAG: protein-glutamate O-methyltransferase CheR [Chloroflexota bacterium]